MIYTFVILCAATLAVLATVQTRVARLAGWLTALILALLAGMRGTSVDYNDYLFLMDLMITAEEYLDLPARLMVGKDPLFGALMAVVIAYGWNYSMLFVLAAALGVGLKVIAFERGFGQAAVPLFASLCLYYFLHDFTQIRVAVALGWCYWGFVELYRQRPGRALLLSVVGVGFHASAAMLLLYGPVLRLRGWTRGAMALTVTIVLVALVPFAVEAFGVLGDRGETNTGQTGAGWLPITIDCVKLAVLAYVVRDLKHRVDGDLLPLLQGALLLCAVGLTLLFGFSGVTSALAFRSYELFDAFSVFIVAAAFSHGRPVARVAAVLMCAQSLAAMISGGLMVPYTLTTF
jgi:hypothetical protein